MPLAYQTGIVTAMEQRLADISLSRNPATGPEREHLSLQWRGEANVDFREFAFRDPTMEHGGVYVIYTGGRAHRLGQATRVRDRLRAHQQDQRVVRSTEAPLSVAWALVPHIYRDGVEAYLGRVLLPEIAERFPAVDPIRVNLPEPLRIAVRSPDFAQSLRASLSRTIQGGRAASNITHAESADTSFASDDKVDADKLASALEALMWLHAKDAKNSDIHCVTECPMCAVIADIEPLISHRRLPPGQA